MLLSLFFWIYNILCNITSLLIISSTTIRINRCDNQNFLVLYVYSLSSRVIVKPFLFQYFTVLNWNRIKLAFSQTSVEICVLIFNQHQGAAIFYLKLLWWIMDWEKDFEQQKMFFFLFSSPIHFQSKKTYLDRQLSLSLSLWLVGWTARGLLLFFSYYYVSV